MSRRKITFLILLIIGVFLFMPNVKADKCIDNYGSFSSPRAGNNYSVRKSGNVQITSGNVIGKKWGTSAVSGTFEIQAGRKYYITKIYYEVGACTGEIPINSKNQNQSYEINFTINKGYVSYLTIWGVQQNKKVGATQKVKNGTTTVNENLQLGITKESIPIRFWDRKSDKREIKSESGTNTDRIACDELWEVFSKYWTWIMILMPIVTMLMIGLDLLRTIVSSDPENGGGDKGSSMSLNKVGKNAIRRATALIVLLFLPYLLKILFGWFNLPFCYK